MVTWRLWQLIRYPLRQNEIFRWVWRKNHIPQEMETRQLSHPLKVLAMFVGVCIVLVAIPIALVVILLSALALPIFLLIFNGTILGLYWVNKITMRLAHHLRGTRSALIGASPRSTSGISWIMATVCIHRSDILRTTYRIIQGVAGIAGALLGIALILIGINLSDSPLLSSQLNLLLDILAIMGFVLVIWIDHIQSIVVAVLIAMLAPTYTTERPLIRIAAMSIYITLQMFFYAVMVVCLRFIQFSSAFIFDNDIVRRLVVIAVMLILFYGVREWLISNLYHILLKRYEVAEDEFQIVVTA